MPWKEDVTPAEKREARFETWSAAEGVLFESPEAKASYNAAVAQVQGCCSHGEDTRQGARISLRNVHGAAALRRNPL